MPPKVLGKTCFIKENERNTLIKVAFLRGLPQMRQVFDNNVRVSTTMLCAFGVKKASFVCCGVFTADRNLEVDDLH